MKKIIIPILLISTVAIWSCRKITDDVSTVVNVSYPVIVLNGDEVVSTGIGTGAYVDPGATGTDDITGVSSSLTPVSNNVDLTQAGFYSVKYSMKNANGYISSKTRLILVTPIDPAVDLSGTYARTANGQEVTITKRGTGLYTTDNVGGVAGLPQYVFDVYFGQISDTEIQIPSQPNPLGGDVSGSDGALDISPSDTTIAYRVLGSGFGTALRTFSHQ
jgi:hypothetical protein